MASDTFMLFVLFLFEIMKSTVEKILNTCNYADKHL